MQWKRLFGPLVLQTWEMLGNIFSSSQHRRKVRWRRESADCSLCDTVLSSSLTFVFCLLSLSSLSCFPVRSAYMGSRYCVRRTFFTVKAHWKNLGVSTNLGKKWVHQNCWHSLLRLLTEETSSAGPTTACISELTQRPEHVHHTDACSQFYKELIAVETLKKKYWEQCFQHHAISLCLVVFCLFYPAEMLWGFLSLMNGFFWRISSIGFINSSLYLAVIDSAFT